MSKYESEEVERKKVLLPSLSRSSRGTFAKLSQKVTYNPGFPASATYDGRHSIEAGLR